MDSSTGDDARQQKLRFAAVIEQLGVIYGKEIDELLLRSYWDVLGEQDVNQTSMRAKRHAQVSRFFPKPSELMQEATNCKAMKAWTHASEVAEKIGSYRSIDFEDRVINAVIRYMGGWPKFCAIESNDESWRRKEFLEAYELLAEDSEIETTALIAPLDGLIASRERAVLKIGEISTFNQIKLLKGS
ncbi:MAG: DUF6475 domain-containing protein [Alphaproteobacteria bacterium]